MDDDHSPTAIKIIREPFLIRNPWFSIVLVMLFYFLFQLVPQLVYIFFVDASIRTSYPYIQRIIEFGSLAFLLLGFIPFLRIPKDNRNYKQYLKDIQLTTVTWKSVWVGIVTTLVVFVLAYSSVYLSAILSKFYYIRVKGLYYLTDVIPRVVWDPSYLLDPYLDGINVYYALTPGIMEELAFRGIILVLLMKKYPRKKAVIIDGVLFGMYHLLNLIGPTINYVSESIGLSEYLQYVRSVGFQVIYAGSLGIAWAFLCAKSNSLIPCILAHWLIDAFGGLVLYPNIGEPWIYFICITLLGIGVLPAILDIYIIKLSYKNSPWTLQAEEEYK